MKLFQKTSFNLWFLIIASTQVFLGLFKLSSIPSVLYDEPLYSYTALFFSEHVNFQHDFHQFSGKEFCLYPFILGTVFFLFGPSLIVGRLVSVVLGVITLYFFMRLLSKISLPHSMFILISTSFVVLNTNIVAFRIIRPEALLLCFGTVAIYYFFKLCHQPKVSITHQFLLGFSLGGLLGTHLIGALFAIGIGSSVFIYLYKTRTLFQLKWILLGSLLPAIVFIGNILYLFISVGVSNQTGKVVPTLQLFKSNFIIFFWQNYAMSFKRFFIVMAELCLLSYSCFNVSFFIRTLALTCLGFLVFGLFSISDFIRPYFALLPLSTLIIFGHLLKEKGLRIKPILVGVLLIYTCNHIAGNMFIFFKNWNNTSMATIQKTFKPFLTSSSVKVGGTKKLWFISPSLSWYHPKKHLRQTTPFYYFVQSQPPSGISSLSQSKDVYHNTNTSTSQPLLPDFFQNKKIHLLKEMQFTGYDLIQLYKVY